MALRSQQSQLPKVNSPYMLGFHPRLKHKKSVIEFVTGKSIDELSDLKFLQLQLGLPDLAEELDESSTSAPTAFTFAQPVNYLHSTARTYYRMPAAKESGQDDDQQHGAIFAISGPVIVAENMRGVAMYELCKVGKDELVGEVIRIEADKAYIQVYEETGEL